MRYRANDPTGWTLLGRNYLIFGNPPQAVRALERAVLLYRAGDGRVPPDVLASYGIAQAQMAQAMTPEAEATFRDVLAIDPKNQDARYYLGLGHVSRGENEEALKMWEALAAEPGPAPWRDSLPDQIAVLAARLGRAPAPGAATGPTAGGAQPPNIPAMVQQLAARLATQGGDLNDWLMLIRAYGVLGQPDKASAVLHRAREIFADDPAAQGELKKQATASGLE
jgi:cytochrome c-type biogenesis protein CcmH